MPAIRDQLLGGLPDHLSNQTIMRRAFLFPDSQAGVFHVTSRFLDKVYHFSAAYIRERHAANKARRQYIDDGCDEFDWDKKGSASSEQQRRKDHEDQLKSKDKNLEDAKKAQAKYCGR